MITAGYGVGAIVTRGFAGEGWLAPSGAPSIMRVSGTGRYLPEEASAPLAHEQLLADDEEILLLII